MDEQLRKNARAVEEAADDIAAQARKIAALLRAGRLYQNRVSLAAHLGNRAAQLVTGYMPPEKINRNFRWWLVGLSPWGKEALVRVTLATTYFVLVRAALDDDMTMCFVRIGTMLDKVHAWLDHASEELREEIGEMHARYCRTLEEATKATGRPAGTEEKVLGLFLGSAYYKTFLKVRGEMTRCVYAVVEDLVQEKYSREYPESRSGPNLSLDYGKVRVHGPDSLRVREFLKSSEEEIRETIRRDLLSWALKEV